MGGGTEFVERPTSSSTNPRLPLVISGASLLHTRLL